MIEDVKELQNLAEQGDSNAQYELGTKYFTGDGIEKNTDEALKWFKLSADQGNAAAKEMVNGRFNELKSLFDECEEINQKFDKFTNDPLIKKIMEDNFDELVEKDGNEINEKNNCMLSIEKLNKKMDDLLNNPELLKLSEDDDIMDKIKDVEINASSEEERALASYIEQRYKDIKR